MKNNCFAMNRGKCKVLLQHAFKEYQKEACCGNEGCPFYKPKGQEKTYKRGLSVEEKTEMIERLKNEN